MDSIYTPVSKVNYKVENTRVGQVTDFDKLTLEVWTNGVISAEDAVSLAAKIITSTSTSLSISRPKARRDIMVEKGDASKEKGP